MLRIAAGAVVLALLVMAAGPERLAEHLTELSPQWLGLAAVLYAGSIVLRGVRLWLMIAARVERGDWTRASAITVFSLSLNGLLPFRMGDISRLFLLATGMGITLRDGMLVTIIERWFDVAVLLAALAAGLSLQYFAAEGGGAATTLAYTAVIPLVAVAMVLVVPARWPATVTALARLPFVGLLPGAMRRALPAALNAYRDAVAAYVQWWRWLVNAGLTGAIWGIQLLEYGVLFNAMGMLPPPSTLVAGFCLFMFTFAVNFIPGQVGTYEALFVASFGIAGMNEPHETLALAITIHVVNTLLLALLGAFAYLHIDVDWADLRYWWRHRELRAVQR
ncbi:MAG: lysylphosphatidylglycerol synthase transmembrane domain-containing protein [Chloroflexota bacterium]